MTQNNSNIHLSCFSFLLAHLLLWQTEAKMSFSHLPWLRRYVYSGTGIYAITAYIYNAIYHSARDMSSSSLGGHIAISGCQSSSQSSGGTFFNLSCQVSSWSVQSFGHSTPTSQTGQTDRTNRTGQTMVWQHRANLLQTVAQKPTRRFGSLFKIQIPWQKKRPFSCNPFVLNTTVVITKMTKCRVLNTI